MGARAADVARRHWPLLLALGLGLALRLALWGNLPRLGLVGDEAEYLAAADWLAAGRGFAWHTQYLWTRAPLYPLFLGAHVALFGRELWPIFATQTVLSLLNVALVYALARMLTAGLPGAAAAPGIAALLTALYLPLATYAQLLLGETLSSPCCCWRCSPLAPGCSRRSPAHRTAALGGAALSRRCRLCWRAGCWGWRR